MRRNEKSGEEEEEGEEGGTHAHIINFSCICAANFGAKC